MSLVSNPVDSKTAAILEEVALGDAEIRCIFSSIGELVG